MTNEHGKLDGQGYGGINKLPDGSFTPIVGGSLDWIREKSSTSLAIDHTVGGDTEVKIFL